MADRPPLARSCLIDNSTYARTADPAVAHVWMAALRARQLVACEPFLLEALYSSRSGDELRRDRADLLAAMPRVSCDATTWELALAAQERMADAAGLMHRRRPIDYLVAAAAAQHGLGVLHYDRDYDLLAEHSGLEFSSLWVVPAGTVD